MLEDKEDENGYLLTDSRPSIYLFKVLSVLYTVLDPKCERSSLLVSTEEVIMLFGCHFKPIQI